MSGYTRRKFLQNSLTASGFLLYQALSPSPMAQTNGKAASPTVGYGPLSPTASTNTGEILLSLPQGFHYNVFGKTGTPMSDKRPTPAMHDGMGVFDMPNGMLAIVRNHEIQDLVGSKGFVSGTTPYDPNAGGGTTTLIIDRATQLPVSDFVSASGTVRNCSGGMTPWNTWITCEETVGGPASGYARAHGYCFEVKLSLTAPPPSAPAPVPLKQMGRFQHEGAAVDRTTGIVYLTEDNHAAGNGFYRFIPNSYGKLADGGKLQMLKIRGRTNYDTRSGQLAGETLLVDWVDIPNPDPVSAEGNPAAVFEQGYAAGGAVFARLEGCYAEMQRIVFISTTGGNSGLGQVWEYRDRKVNSGRLKLLFEPTSPSQLHTPDNVCFGPRGQIFMTEDNGSEIHIRILDPNGDMSDFAKNIVPGFTTSELTGCCFSPGRSTLFVNIQTPGITFSIWGPW